VEKYNRKQSTWYKCYGGWKIKPAIKTHWHLEKT
jgi:hypothetical protein